MKVFPCLDWLLWDAIIFKLIWLLIDTAEQGLLSLTEVNGKDSNLYKVSKSIRGRYLPPPEISLQPAVEEIDIPHQLSMEEVDFTDNEWTLLLPREQ